MTPEDLLALAIDVSEEGMRAGELPVGAVVARGDRVIGRAFTSERTLSRRLVHAEVLALQQADALLGWPARPEPLIVATTLEPCLMCLGACMSLGVTQIYFGLEAPDDGASRVPEVWRPARQTMPFSHLPAIIGGVLRDECQDQFRRYATTAPRQSLRRYAEYMAGI